MQPFHVVILLFSICLIHGIYRAIQDVRQEAARAAYLDAMREVILKTTGLSEVFLGISKSAECASESIRRFSLILGVDSPGGMVKNSKEIHGYLSKDCIS